MQRKKKVTALYPSRVSHAPAGQPAFPVARSSWNKNDPTPPALKTLDPASPLLITQGPAKRLLQKHAPASAINVFLGLFVMVLLLLPACGTPGALQLEEGEFVPSEIGKEVFFEQYAGENPVPRALSGRASVQVSEPGHTERANVHFRSDRYESLLLVRTSLGIEGGRIYSNPDSVIIYNRIDEVAHKMSHYDAAWFYLNGIGAMNLLSMLYPLAGPHQIEAIYETGEHFLIETTYGDRHILDRERLLLRRTERSTLHPEAYSTFHFENHAELEGHRLPRRIQILSYDEKSNIFLVIRSLEINPSDLEFDPEIPDNIDIIRL